MLSIGNVRRLALPADAAPVVQGTCAVLAAAALLIARASAASDAEPTSPGAARPAPGTLEITEYRLEGVTQLGESEIEPVLAPFLGPGRALEDVERARAALEKAYSDKGFQTVTVAIPPQTVRDGVVVLRVTEGKVGRLRVRGAQWFSPMDVKRQAPSVAEGTVPNFNAVVRDLVALNQLPDRRVTPALRPGEVPGTIDVDLNVEDALPLHGALEANNRYSASTTNLRLNGTLRYDNLWQAGHSLAFSFQTAPRRPDDALVFSLSYLARVPEVSWLSFALNGVIQDSDVSTLGTIGVRGKGRMFGARAVFTLPGSADFFHTVSAGVDYKHFEEGLTLGEDTLQTPVTYWPVTAQYAATWSGGGAQTQLAATVVFNLRSLSSSSLEFDAKRYASSGSFIYWRGELSRTQDLPRGFQVSGRLLGQYAADPVLSSEQLTAGGVDSVRGYLEVEASGDWGGLASLELRTPSLARWSGTALVKEWRLVAFFEGGRVALRQPLPEQKGVFWLWGTGGGVRVRLLDHVSGYAMVGVPLTSIGTTARYRSKFHLSLVTDF